MSAPDSSDAGASDESPGIRCIAPQIDYDDENKTVTVRCIDPFPVEFHDGQVNITEEHTEDRPYLRSFDHVPEGRAENIDIIGPTGAPCHVLVHGGYTAKFMVENWPLKQYEKYEAWLATRSQDSSDEEPDAPAGMGFEVDSTWTRRCLRIRNPVPFTACFDDKEFAITEDNPRHLWNENDPDGALIYAKARTTMSDDNEACNGSECDEEEAWAVSDSDEDDAWAVSEPLEGGWHVHFEVIAYSTHRSR